MLQNGVQFMLCPVFLILNRKLYAPFFKIFTDHFVFGYIL